MRGQHADVVLISADARLADVVTRCRPPHAELRCIDPARAADRPRTARSGATQFWVDLDTAPTPDATLRGQLERCRRRVYFQSGLRRRSRAWPSGIVVRKPCSPSMIELLWAGLAPADTAPSAESRGGAPAESPAAAAPPRPAAAGLPSWLAEFHVLDTRTLCARCVALLPPRLGYRDVSVYLYDEQSDLLTLAESNHRRPIDLTVSPTRCPQRLMARALRAGCALGGADLEPGGDPSGEAPDGRLVRAGRYRDRDCLVVPLICEGRPQGVLNFSRRTTSRRSGSDRDAPRADDAAVFDFVARAFHHARLFERARTEARIDGLTGLANYRAFREALARETERVRRFPAPLSLVMLDLDGLKQVNDRHGHLAGDAVLRGVTTRITLVLRQLDTAARVGGDEFAILLPGTGLGGARHAALRILDRVRSDPPRCDGRALQIALSCGAAQFDAAFDPDAFVKAADEAMYTAKRRGGNCVVCRPIEAAPGPAPEPT